MMLMVLSQGASIISIIGGSFLQSEVQMGLGASFQKPLVLMMVFWGSRDPKNPSKSLRRGGFSSKPHANFRLRSGRAPGRNGGPMMLGSVALASAPWRSQGHGLRQQPESVARFHSAVVKQQPFPCLVFPS